MFAMSFLPRLFFRNQKINTSAETSIFLCAPVTFEKDGLVELPETESEVKEISQLFSSKNFKSTVLTRQEADENKSERWHFKKFQLSAFCDTWYC